MFGWRALAALVTFVFGGCGSALANVGAAASLSPSASPSNPTMVRLVPNGTVTTGYPATLVMVWRFLPDGAQCPGGGMGSDGPGVYCVEIDAAQQPHRCVVTTPRVLRHALLGAAAESCFQLSLAVGRP